MTVIVRVSTRRARRGAPHLRLAAALSAAALAIAAAPAIANDADRNADGDAPVVRRSTVPGVGERVEKPLHKHHTLSATVGDDGEVTVRGSQGAAPTDGNDPDSK